jgi:hypothetical protein
MNNFQILGVFWIMDHSAYYNDDIFLKHRKKRSSGGSTVSSAGHGRPLDVNGHLPLERPLPDSSAI